MSKERSPGTNPLYDPGQDVVADTAALQGMAHPLRLRLLGLLRVHGPSTATKLATRCGESSGLASYHLRQLAVAGLVTDAEPADLAGMATPGGRQRWWKATGRATFTGLPPAGDEAAAAVSDEYMRAALAAITAKARNWLSVEHTWPRAWQEATNFTDVPLRLTQEEANQLSDDLDAVLARYRRHDPTVAPASAGVPANAVIVAAQYQVFPEPEQDPPDPDDL
jgi:hypothetical protein